MTTFLGIDCGVDGFGLGIAEDPSTHHLHKDSERQTDEGGPSKILRELLEKAELNRETIDGLLFVTGPGSFTGLRLGLSFAQGLALANDLPIYTIDRFTLAFLQYGKMRLCGMEEGAEKSQTRTSDSPGEEMMFTFPAGKGQEIVVSGSSLKDFLPTQWRVRKEGTNPKESQCISLREPPDTLLSPCNKRRFWLLSRLLESGYRHQEYFQRFAGAEVGEIELHYGVAYQAQTIAQRSAS